ncbi:hypothetical protein PCYB_031530, partial [Plasmodium cynomolgi strain B]
MSQEWSDALQWSGNKNLESGKEEEEEEGEEKKRTNCYELINDKIFVYRCSTCLLVFTCVHSFSNHVLSENHQIKQLNCVKKGKYFRCLRCRYVCMSIAKIISHIELYNHGHNILRKIKRRMVYNGIASCSCRVKCYTFYSQNKYCFTTGDPILSEYERVPNLQQIGEGIPNLEPVDGGDLSPHDQSDSHHDGNMEFLQKGHPQREANNPDKKNTLGKSTTYSSLQEANPSYVREGVGTMKNSTQNRPPNYEPIFEDHHNLDQFLTSELVNKIDQNMQGEREEVKDSFLRSIQNSAKKLAALDTLYLYEQQEGKSLSCSDPSTPYRNTKETHTKDVGNQIDTHRNGIPSGMHSLEKQQMSGFHKRDKLSPSEEDLKKYFSPNFLSHIFDYQPRNVVPTMGGPQRTDSGEPSNGKLANVMRDAHLDARHDMRVVTPNITHNVAERKTRTPHREPFTKMEYPPREGPTDATPYLTQRIDDSDSFLSSKYWRPQKDEMDKMDKMSRGAYKHMDGGKGSRQAAGETVGATNQLGYMKYTVGTGEQSGDPHTASLFPPMDTALTYMNKEKNENIIEERERKKKLDLLTFYRLQGGRSPYNTHSDLQNEGTNADVQNGEGDRFPPQLNKASHHFNQPYEDLLNCGKCFRGWVAEEENCKGENPFNINRRDGPPSFTATTGGAYRGVKNPNAQRDASRQVVLTKGMNEWNVAANQLSAPSSSGANFNARRLSQPSRDTTVSSPTNNPASPTQEEILNNIFEDPSDDKKNYRTPSETAALNQKRQSFIDEIGEIKKSIEKENQNNRQPSLTHMSLPYGQRMAPGIPLRDERINFSKSGMLKKQSFYLSSRNNDGSGAYPDFKSIRTNDPRGAGALWG